MRVLLRLPLLVRMIGRLVGDAAIPTRVKAALAVALLYLASPLDALPDLLPFVGYVDDILIAAVVLDGLLNWVDRRIVLRYWPGSPHALDRLARIAATLAAWVPARAKARVFGAR